MTLFSIFRIVPLVVAVVVTGVHAQAKQERFDLDKFRALPDAGKLDFVMKVLEVRDAALGNVRYRVAEDVVNVRKSDGRRRNMSKSQQEFRRLGPTFWTRVQDFKRYEADTGFEEDAMQNWDGKAARRLHLPPFSGQKTPMGEIGPAPYVCFYQHRYAAALGFFVKIHFHGVSVRQWLRDAAADPRTTVSVSDGIYRGLPALRVFVKDDVYERELWLDPARGFMTLFFGMATTFSSDHKSMENSVEVTEAKQVAGVWVPMRLKGLATVDRSQETSEETFTVPGVRNRPSAS
jgi:hypothetical protein